MYSYDGNKILGPGPIATGVCSSGNQNVHIISPIIIHIKSANTPSCLTILLQVVGIIGTDRWWVRLLRVVRSSSFRRWLVVRPLCANSLYLAVAVVQFFIFVFPFWPVGDAARLSHLGRLLARPITSIVKHPRQIYPIDILRSQFAHTIFRIKIVALDMTTNRAEKLRTELQTIDNAVAAACTLLTHAEKYLCKASEHIEELRVEIDPPSDCEHESSSFDSQLATSTDAHDDERKDMNGQ